MTDTLLPDNTAPAPVMRHIRPNLNPPGTGLGTAAIVLALIAMFFV